MMVRIRNASQSWIAKFVAGVIIVVLVLFGFGAFNLFGVNEPAVATVNGEDITERRLAAEIERTKESFRESYGASITDDQLDAFVDEEFALRRLIDMELFMQASRELALTLSDIQFQRVLTSDPTFQTDGVFDEEQFRETLARSGISTQTLRASQEESTVRTQLLRALEDTAFATASEISLHAKFDKQVRDISVLEFKLEDFEDPDSITDDDIMSRYELNRDDYLTEGSFDFEYVEIKREQFLADTELSEEEIQDLFNAEIAAKKSEAQRRGRHLLIKVDDSRSDEDALNMMADIQARLSDGESLSDLASELSEDAGSKEDGGDLGFADRVTYVKEFADALWSLEIGEVSDPVKTQFGYHLIELLEVEEIELPTLDERREGLVEDHRLQLASQALQDVSTEVDKLAFEQSDSLQAIVDDFSVEVQELKGVDRSSIEGVFSELAVRQAFLESDVIDNGFNSRVVEIGETAIVVGRMTGRTEPTLRSLEDVSDGIKSELAQEAATAARDAKQDEVLQQLLEDRNFDAASMAAGSDWIVYESQVREDFAVDPAVLDAAFAQALPEDGERVIVGATSEFTPTSFVVVVSRQNLADYAVLGNEEQDTLTTSAANDAKTRALSSFVSSLRSEASIKTEIFAYQ